MAEARGHTGVRVLFGQTDRVRRDEVDVVFRERKKQKTNMFVSQAFRKLNGLTMPFLVKVPKNAEEDERMKSEREGPDPRSH